jgi:hypothetical protein
MLYEQLLPSSHFAALKLGEAVAIQTAAIMRAVGLKPNVLNQAFSVETSHALAYQRALSAS